MGFIRMMKVVKVFIIGFIIYRVRERTPQFLLCPK
jgi:hypothetical protein